MPLSSLSPSPLRGVLVHPSGSKRKRKTKRVRFQTTSLEHVSNPPSVLDRMPTPFASARKSSYRRSHRCKTRRVKPV